MIDNPAVCGVKTFIFSHPLPDGFAEFISFSNLLFGKAAFCEASKVDDQRIVADERRCWKVKTLLLIIVSAHLQTAFPCRQRAIFAWREITITEPTLIHLDDNDDPSRIFLAPRSSNRWCIGMGCVPSIEGGHPKTTGKTLLGTSRVYFAARRSETPQPLKCVSGLLLRSLGLSATLRNY